ncbi:MAG: ABC transporter substrate-binding protein [bacterium]|nr:ABC transporter substrate-binding protein [bacterium]
MDKVMEKVNKEYLEPWLNTTLQVNFLAWGESGTKYPLLLSGGDPVDLLYAADWMGYTSHVSSGGYTELTPEFLQQYLPYSYDLQTEAAWKQVSIDGKIYAIPSPAAEFNSYDMIVIRQDLLDKYKIEGAIDNWDKLKDALITIAGNEEGVYGIGQRSNNELLWTWWQSHGMWYLDQSAAIMYQTHGNEDLPDWDTDVSYLYTCPEFYEFCVEMNEMAAKGVWDPNVVNDNSSVETLFENGRLACVAWNSTINTIGKNMEEQGTGTYAIYDVTPEQKAQRAKATNNMYTIPNNCKDPARAALVLDCLRGFQEVSLLVVGGIEGEHYVLREDGYRDPGPNAANYGWAAWAWALNRADLPKLYDEDPRQQIYMETLEGKEYSPLASGFTFNPAPVETEIAVINDVIGTYGSSLTLGMYGADLDAKYQEFVEKLNQAGLEKVMEEAKRQWDEYCAGL